MLGKYGAKVPSDWRNLYQNEPKNAGSSKDLSDEQIDKFIQQSGGDPEKAKALARQAGFEV